MYLDSCACLDICTGKQDRNAFFFLQCIFLQISVPDYYRYFQLSMSVRYYGEEHESRPGRPVSIKFGEGSPYMMSGEVKLCDLSSLWTLSLFYASWILLKCVCLKLWFWCLQCFQRPAENLVFYLFYHSQYGSFPDSPMWNKHKCICWVV